MKQITRHLVGGLTLIALLSAPVSLSPVFAQERDPEIVALARKTGPQRQEVLLSHGIRVTDEGLLGFLNKGFARTADGKWVSLPDSPQVKTEVVLAAIQEMGFRQSKTATPLLVQMMKGELPSGARQVLDRDMEKFPMSVYDETRQTFTAYIRYNSLVALGLIGDSSAGDSIKTFISETDNPSFVIEGAVSLGLMDNGKGLNELARIADSNDELSLAKLFEAVYFLTGRNYDVTENTSIARRREVVEEFKDWVYFEGNDYTPTRASILRRRVDGKPDYELPKTTLRGALRATKEFADYDGRYFARHYLRNLGAAATPEYEQISLDPLEDNDIRRAAMEWYAAADPKEAKKVMKKLKKDENESIRLQAEKLIEEIEKVLSAQ